MQHHTKHKTKTWIFFFVVFTIALTITTPVLAEYLGPNRTVTETISVCKVFLKECQYVAEKGEWKYKTENTWSCSLESKPWQAYSGNARTCNNNNHDNGYQYWERDDVLQTVTNTYLPATINGSLQNCTQQGNWCTTAPQLFLS